MKEAQEGTKRREKGEIERSDRERGLMLWINETKERQRKSCEKSWVRDSEKEKEGLRESCEILGYQAIYRTVLSHIWPCIEPYQTILRSILGYWAVQKKKLLQTSMQPHPGYMPCPNVSNTSVATKMLYTCFPGLDHLNWSKTPQ